ncbi:MAG: hypothetical protein ABI559_07430 [Chloroflexota bacterium]
MAKKATQHIDEKIGKRIQELHKKHQQLGSTGIGRLLESEGIRIDDKELKAFLSKKNFKVAPTMHWQNSSDALSGFGVGMTKKGK